jgi:DNA polymerase-3 subunit gamma/tau
MLTNEAFNALLKTLEEPPPHVIFIFATTEPQKVPPTILSRCQVFEFTPLPEELIEKKLVGIADAEGVELSPGAAKLIARRAEGSLRDAEVLLEQLAHSGPVREENVVALLGLPPLAELDRFLDALRNKNAVVALDVVEKHLERGRDLGLFLEEAALRARDRILAGEGDLVELARRLFSWRAEIPKTVSPRLHLELEILSLCGAPTRPIHEPSVSSPKAAELLAEAPQVKKSRGIGEEGPTEVESPEGGSASVAVDGVGSAETGETGPGALFAPTTEDGGEEVLKSSGSRKWPIPEEFDNPWDQLITAALADRVAVATFLLPAEVEFRDGILTITLPEGYRFHYEMLRELEVRRYVEELARRFFQPLLSLRIEYVGEEREKLSLEEGAELLARYLEGRVVKEGG